MTPARVEIEIEDLVLRGVPPEQADAVVEALSARLEELARLDQAWQDRTWQDRTRQSAQGPTASWSAPLLRPRVPATPAATPADLGRLAAEAVWRSVAPSQPGRAGPGGEVR